MFIKRNFDGIVPKVVLSVEEVQLLGAISRELKHYNTSLDTVK